VTRFFTADYVERVTLRDGTAVILRLLTVEDAPLLAAGFAKLSPESRYARFLSPKSQLSADELRYLCDIDHEAHLAIGAVFEDGDGAGNPIGAGIARFVRLPDHHATAEAAIAVADDAQARGLGKLLFLRLCAAGAERGIERFRCELLGTNTQMAALLAAVAPERSVETSGGVMCVEMALPNIAATEPPTSPAPTGPLYAFFRGVAANAIEWTEAVRRLLRPR
jgi:acetyltransferase